MKVADKVAIVTGGGNGIGAALAAKLAQLDARIVVADSMARLPHAVTGGINADRPGVAVASAGDVSDTAHIKQLIALADNEFGPVDLYFANAGITGVAGLDVTDDEWDQSIDVNLRAHIRAAQLLVPGWVERGRGLLRQHRVGGRVAHPTRVGDLLGDQARRSRIRRMAEHHLRRPGRAGQLPVPDGRQHQTAVFAGGIRRSLGPARDARRHLPRAM